MSKYKPGVPLAGTENDKRIRLTTRQKDEIKEWHRNGTSIHELSRMYCVSRRLIQFILFPERIEAVLLARKLHGGSMSYYDRRRHKEDIRRYRTHKQEVKEKLRVEQRNEQREKEIANCVSEE